MFVVTVFSNPQNNVILQEVNLGDIAVLQDVLGKDLALPVVPDKANVSDSQDVVKIICVNPDFPNHLNLLVSLLLLQWVSV